MESGHPLAILKVPQSKHVSGTSSNTEYCSIFTHSNGNLFLSSRVIIQRLMNVSEVHRDSLLLTSHIIAVILWDNSRYFSASVNLSRETINKSGYIIRNCRLQGQRLKASEQKNLQTNKLFLKEDTLVHIHYIFKNMQVYFLLCNSSLL